MLSESDCAILSLLLLNCIFCLGQAAFTACGEMQVTYSGANMYPSCIRLALALPSTWVCICSQKIPNESPVSLRKVWKGFHLVVVVY